MYDFDEVLTDTWSANGAVDGCSEMSYFYADSCAILPSLDWSPYLPHLPQSWLPFIARKATFCCGKMRQCFAGCISGQVSLSHSDNVFMEDLLATESMSKTVYISRRHQNKNFTWVSWGVGTFWRPLMSRLNKICVYSSSSSFFFTSPTPLFLFESRTTKWAKMVKQWYR